MAVVTKLHLFTFQKDQHLCFREQQLNIRLQVKRGCFVQLLVPTSSRHGVYMRNCCSFRGEDDRKVGEKEMGSERKLWILMKNKVKQEKGDGFLKFLKSLKTVVFRVSRVGSQSQDEYEQAMAKVDEIFSSSSCM